MQLGEARTIVNDFVQCDRKAVDGILYVGFGDLAGPKVFQKRIGRFDKDKGRRSAGLRFQASRRWREWRVAISQGTATLASIIIM
ncbi:MAG TPA: hypothetical protein VGX71_25260 [Pseudaminobacter sp.]|nr:hypothetical protein [Pseudaminobacter sp.]